MKQHLLNKLGEHLKDRGMHPADAVNEISLFIAFCNLSTKYRTTNNDLADFVAKGQLSLKQAYQQLAEGLPIYKNTYESAKLPLLLSAIEVETYVKEVRLISQGNSWISELWWLQESLGKFSGLSKLPQELIKLMSVLGLKNEQVSSVYMPFAASVQLADEATAHAGEVFSESNNAEGVYCASVLISGIDCKKSDPIESPKYIKENGGLRQFSRVLMVPPFGLKIRDAVPDLYHRFQNPAVNGDVFTLLHGIAQCSERLITIMPMGFLFRGAADKYCREMLIERGILDAVIQLPAGLLSNTGIPTCLLVVDKKRDPKSPVLFYNADNEDLVRPERRGPRKNLHGWQTIAKDVISQQSSKYGVLADANRIKQNDYDFSVSRYVLSEASKAIQNLEDTKPLSQIVELIRAQLLKDEPELQGDEYLEVGIRDITPGGFISEPAKQIQLSGKSKERAALQLLQPGDILLTIKGNVGKVAIVGDNCGANWVAGQIFQVLRLNAERHITKPEYLYRYLSSTLIQNYLQDHASGSGVSVLKTSDIKGLPVPLMPLEDQQKVINTHQEIIDAHSRIAEIQKEIETLSQEHWNLTTS